MSSSAQHNMTNVECDVTYPWIVTCIPMKEYFQNGHKLISCFHGCLQTYADKRGYVLFVYNVRNVSRKVDDIVTRTYLQHVGRYYVDNKSHVVFRPINLGLLQNGNKLPSINSHRPMVPLNGFQVGLSVINFGDFVDAIILIGRTNEDNKQPSLLLSSN